MFWKDEPITQIDINNLQSLTENWRKDDRLRHEKRLKEKPPSQKKAFVLQNPIFETEPEYKKPRLNILNAKVWLQPVPVVVQSEVECSKCALCGTPTFLKYCRDCGHILAKRFTR